MKTIEEKAKAYDEIIERAKTMLAAGEVMYGKENNASQLITDLIPELVESEDERMMREFNDWLCEEIECRTNDLRDEKDRRTLNMLCYVLTKVKEWLEKQKEHKPIEFKNDELVEIIKGEFEGFRRLLKKKGIDYEPQYGYWEGFARLFDSSAREYVKEQKPVEQKVSRSRIHYELLQNGIITMEEYLKLTENLYFPRVQKPAEWSDKDKNIFNLALDLIKHSDDCAGILDKELAVKWFTELPSRFVPQQKQEWSEEDEKNFSSLCEFFTTWSEKHYTAYGRQEAMEKWLFNRFKYLNPQPKMEWSEEDEKIMQTMIKEGDLKPSEIAWLKSLRPSWKPSEEQMEELYNTFYTHSVNAKSRDALESLYNQLKKL